MPGTPGKRFLLVFGALFIVLGLVGIVSDMVYTTSAERVHTLIFPAFEIGDADRVPAITAEIIEMFEVEDHGPQHDVTEEYLIGFLPAAFEADFDEEDEGGDRVSEAGQHIIRLFYTGTVIDADDPLLFTYEVDDYGELVVVAPAPDQIPAIVGVRNRIETIVARLFAALESEWDAGLIRSAAADIIREIDSQFYSPPPERIEEIVRRTVGGRVVYYEVPLNVLFMNVPAANLFADEWATEINDATILPVAAELLVVMETLGVVELLGADETEDLIIEELTNAIARVFTPGGVTARLAWPLFPDEPAPPDRRFDDPEKEARRQEVLGAIRPYVDRVAVGVAVGRVNIETDYLFENVPAAHDWAVNWADTRNYDTMWQSAHEIVSIAGAPFIEVVLAMLGIHGAPAWNYGIDDSILLIFNAVFIFAGIAGIIFAGNRNAAIPMLVLASIAFVLSFGGTIWVGFFSVGALATWAVSVCFIIGAYLNCSGFAKTRYSRLVRYAILIGVGFILSYPLFWMIGSSFKLENIDIFGSLDIFPQAGRGTTEHYPAAWQISANNTMTFYYLNTLRFLIPRVIGTVISCTLTAFAIARFSFPGKRVIFTLVIVTLLMPDLAFRIPIFMMFNDMNLINTFASLYLQEMFATGSFFVFMIIQFMRTIPRELDEAAFIDGCGPLRTLFYILVPVLRPIIITVGLLTFMWGMNDFQGPLIFLSGEDSRVLAIALRRIITDYDPPPYSQLFAAAFMALIPTLAIFFMCSKFFVQGVASSGGKE